MSTARPPRSYQTTQRVHLSDLLARQREGQLGDAERRRLDVLMGAYRHGMVRKARALQVAIERGLQPPLSASAG